MKATARQQITKYDTYIKPHLADIEKEVADGKTEMSLAAKYGVSYDTWADYRKKHPEFSEAIKRGNVGLDDAVENALARSAKGYYVEESEEVFDGAGKLIKSKKNRKYIPPSQTAQVFWLKNRRKEDWKDRSVLDVEDGAALPKIDVVIRDFSDSGGENP